MAPQNADIYAIFNQAVERESDDDRTWYLNEACKGDSQMRQEVESLLRAHLGAGNFLGGESPQLKSTSDTGSAIEQIGTEITEFCDAHCYTTRQRLELFVQVCQAVHHAHQKGVIHRDLKPSNILVATEDETAVPKVIDFGIAKAIHQPLNDQSVYTDVAQMIGTPLYMSPEQAQRSGHDIDTRTDVYSLGVLLYELLTGVTPFDREGLKDSSLDDVKRIIREEEPPRPSIRLSTLAQSDPDIDTLVEKHATSLRMLKQELSGELDWIVMKAIEKDRDRRYETATDFARDIHRYLHDEAVEACPPSRMYRLKKLVRRNRGFVAAVAAIALALVLGAAISTGQAIRATKAEKWADRQLEIAQEQERRAKEQQRLAQKQKRLANESAQRERDLRTEAEAARKQSEQVTQFLVDAFRSPDPGRDGRTITVAEMLGQAATRVETEFAEDRVLQAKLMQAIGETYYGLGLFRKSQRRIEKARGIFHDELGLKHPDTLDSMADLAIALRSTGRIKEALTLSQETLRLRKEVLGDDHQQTLELMNNLGWNYHDAGRMEEASALLERAYEGCQKTQLANQRIKLMIMKNLAATLYDLERFDEALPLCQKSLEISRESLGPDHPDTVGLRLLLSQLHRKRSEEAEAELALLKAEQAIVRRTSIAAAPNDTLQMHQVLAQLVQLYESTEQPEKAAAYQEKLEAFENSVRTSEENETNPPNEADSQQE